MEKNIRQTLWRNEHVFLTVMIPLGHNDGHNKLSKIENWGLKTRFDHVEEYLPEVIGIFR